MNNSTSHSLAVKTPLSRLYLALFSAPLLLFLPADIARAADAFFEVHRGFPGKAALIFRKKYSESLNPYAIRFITLILLFTPSSTLVCIG